MLLITYVRSQVGRHTHLWPPLQSLQYSTDCFGSTSQQMTADMEFLEAAVSGLACGPWKCGGGWDLSSNSILSAD